MGLRYTPFIMSEIKLMVVESNVSKWKKDTPGFRLTDKSGSKCLIITKLNSYNNLLFCYFNIYPVVLFLG